MTSTDVAEAASQATEGDIGGTDAFEKQAKEVRMDDVVRIDKSNVFSRCVVDAAIPGLADAAIGLGDNPEGETAGVGPLAKLFGRGVSGAVIDTENLETAERLGGKALESLVDGSLTIETGDNDGDGGSIRSNRFMESGWNDARGNGVDGALALERSIKTDFRPVAAPTRMEIATAIA